MAYLNNDILWMVGQYTITYRNNKKIKDLFDIVPSETRIQTEARRLKNLTVPELKQEFKEAFCEYQGYGDYGKLNNNKTYKIYKTVNGSIRRGKIHYILEILNRYIELEVTKGIIDLRLDSVYSDYNYKKYKEVVDGETIAYYTTKEKQQKYREIKQKDDPKVIKIINDLEEKAMNDRPMGDYYDTAIQNIKRLMELRGECDAVEWIRKLIKKTNQKDLMKCEFEWDIIYDDFEWRYCYGL